MSESENVTQAIKELEGSVKEFSVSANFLARIMIVVVLVQLAIALLS